MPQLNEVSFAQMGALKQLCNIIYIFEYHGRKKSMYLSIDKRSKTNQLLLHP